MALFSLLKRRAAEAPEPKPAGVADADELQSRTRARRRLIGAAVLLVIGVITFPLLFETQPRPVPVDIPMVIPAREGAPALSPPAARTSRLASGKIGEAASAASAVAPAALTPAASAAAVAAAPPAPTPVPTPAPTTTPAPAQPPSAAARKASEPKAAPTKPAAEPTAASAKSTSEPKSTAALATAEPKSPAAKPGAEAKPAGAKPATEAKAAAKPTAEAKGRYVVQVGAYADEASARAARQRVERLGLKTYTQEVEVQGARRIRVRIGPFDSQQEATRALETLKAGKLPGAVLTL